ncbi:MAG: hypothetical protein E7324_01025 [Clostridiales bacterium]|nr:hypothetical protein [Clostridiales bacterium]
MKKRMTAMILMLLMVWMLAPGTALGENFSLQEASVQCPYDAIWLSVSPSGRYLIGYNNDGMDLQSTLLLYDTENRIAAPLAVQVDEKSDAGKSFQKMMQSPGSLRSLQIIWAPDEMHFVFTDTDTLMNVQGYNGLHIGSVREKKITTPLHWSRRTQKDDSGLLAHAGFSADSSTLYYMVYGNAYENKFQMLKYDLITGMETPLFSCLEEADGEKITYVFRALIGVNDDLFITDISTPGGGFAVLRRENGEWQRQLFLREGNLSVQRLEYSPESGYGMVLTCNYKDNQYTAYVFRLDESGNMLSLEPFSLNQTANPIPRDKVINFALSPDGQYAMLVIQEMGVEGRIGMLKLDDLSLSTVSVPEAISGNVQAWGFNVPVAPVSIGYSWGGKYVTGALGRSRALLKLSGMERAENAASRTDAEQKGPAGFYTAAYAENNGTRVNLKGTSSYSTIEIMQDGSFTMVFGTAGDVDEDQGTWQMAQSAGQTVLMLTVDDETAAAILDEALNGIRLIMGDGMFIYYERQE